MNKDIAQGKVKQVKGKVDRPPDNDTSARPL